MLQSRDLSYERGDRIEVYRALTLVVRAYVTLIELSYPGRFLSMWVISAGLVDPSLFLSPLRFALTSSRLTLISTWCGNAMSTFEYGDMGSEAQ